MRRGGVVDGVGMSVVGKKKVEIKAFGVQRFGVREWKVTKVDLLILCKISSLINCFKSLTFFPTCHNLSLSRLTLRDTEKEDTQKLHGSRQRSFWFVRS